MAKKRVWANQQCFCPLTHESTSADRAWQEWPRLSTTWSCRLQLAARAATRVSNRAEQAGEANVQEMQFVCIVTTVRVGQGADQPGRARDGSYASATCFACCLGCRDQATTAARPPRACARAACRPARPVQSDCKPPQKCKPGLQTWNNTSNRCFTFASTSQIWCERHGREPVNQGTTTSTHPSGDL
jgi:hypothetical protein